MNTERFRTFLIFLKFLSASIAIMILSGCVALLAGGAAGGGALVYLNGDLAQTLHKPAPDLYIATMATLKDFHFKVLKDKHDQLTASIESKLSNGKKVWIKIDSVSEDLSKIDVRVGLIGDRDKSGMILDSVDQHLKLSLWELEGARISEQSIFPN